ncbi:MAG: hypothetical protein GY807_06915 [Gammaproteobacteria bacterium]|nr:hypothetical protein [Gammaproteobacteria bacterium]
MKTPISRRNAIKGTAALAAVSAMSASATQAAQAMSKLDRLIAEHDDLWDELAALEHAMDPDLSAAEYDALQDIFDKRNGYRFSVELAIAAFACANMQEIKNKAAFFINLQRKSIEPNPALMPIDIDHAFLPMLASMIGGGAVVEPGQILAETSGHSDWRLDTLTVISVAIGDRFENLVSITGTMDDGTFAAWARGYAVQNKIPH